MACSFLFCRFLLFVILTAAAPGWAKDEVGLAEKAAGKAWENAPADKKPFGSNRRTR